MVQWMRWFERGKDNLYEKQFFEIEKDGFYGIYYENPKGTDCAMIGLFGDDPNDFMAKFFIIVPIRGSLAGIYGDCIKRLTQQTR